MKIRESTIENRTLGEVKARMAHSTDLDLKLTAIKTQSRIQLLNRMPSDRALRKKRRPKRNH